MKVEITEKSDPSGVGNTHHEMTVKEGAKTYSYRGQTVNEVVGKALDDLVYHDGSNGRIKAG